MHLSRWDMIKRIDDFQKGKSFPPKLNVYDDAYDYGLGKLGKLTSSYPNTVIN